MANSSGVEFSLCVEYRCFVKILQTRLLSWKAKDLEKDFGD